MEILHYLREKEDLSVKAKVQLQSGKWTDIRSSTLLDSELDDLLKESVSSVIERERTAFDQSAEPSNRPIILFGAGKLGRKILARLREDHIEPVAFSDNNAALWNETIDGLQVLPPSIAAMKYGQNSTIIISIWSPGSGHSFAVTKKALGQLGCLKVISFVPLFWKYSESFLPFCYLDLPHKIFTKAKDVRAAFSLLADSESKKTFLSQLMWRIIPNFDKLPRCVDQEQYFPDDLQYCNLGDVFVDCGAFDGDTIKKYLERQGSAFSRIVAIEPDPSNFRRLQCYVSTLDESYRSRIELFPMAAGARDERILLEATGTASSIVSAAGNFETKSIALDHALKDLLPTFIKMDIEGSELDALKGAREIIKRCFPVLAICVYHRPDHLWQIPMFISTLSSRYHFFLRAHDEEGWDLVCYAVPDSRLRKP